LKFEPQQFVSLPTFKVDVSNSNIAMVRCGPKNRHQKDMFLEEIGLHYQYILVVG
jgi:hypothetical protein